MEKTVAIRHAHEEKEKAHKMVYDAISDMEKERTASKSKSANFRVALMRSWSGLRVSRGSCKMMLIFSIKSSMCRVIRIMT